MKSVRTRFAPSPTGFLHVGGIRTALFAWLIARHFGGEFILRIEDTDQAREVTGSADHIIQSLQALGLNYDEGPDKSGKHGPYYQSQRLQTYREWAQVLIDKGRAYADPYTPSQVQAFREQAQAEKRPFLFRNHRPESPPKWDGTTPLRFKSDPKAYTRIDAVMGELTTGPEVIDDFILIKTDGFPTYNFAHIIDDYEMQITHVTRTQEFLPSIPNYLNLYEALGFEIPVLATLPFILGPDGKKKLSKRDGAKDVLDYMREGYLPEALVNFIASLGWNDGTEQEIFSREELIEKFSLDRVQKAGARFDEQRLTWMNGHYIRQLSIEELYKIAKDYLPPEAENFDESYQKQVIGLVQERLKFLAEIPELTSFFFAEPTPNMALITENKQLKKLDKTDMISLLEQTITSLENSDFTVTDLTNRLNELLEQTGQKPGILFSLIRVATTWAPASPGLADSLAVLGKDVSLKRLQKSLDTIANS
ncbi:MAG: glutamate--tRNA ligase [Candidatus Saccharimonadales bacterium]